MSSEFCVVLVRRLPATAIEGKKGGGLEPRRASGTITGYIVSLIRNCCLHAQAAKNDGPTEAPDSPLNQLPPYLPVKLTTEPNCVAV